MPYRYDGTAQQQQHCAAVRTTHARERVKKREFAMKFGGRK
jgi:hypothetical protein